MSASVQSFNRLRRRILVLSTGLILLISLMVGLFGIAPFYVYLQGQVRGLDQELMIQAAAVSAYTNKLHMTAEQIASRSAIRDALDRFNRGDMAEHEMVEFSTPKLWDAIAADDDSIGIVRLDSNGVARIALGVSSPAAAYTAAHAADASLILGPFIQDGVPIIVAGAPIRDREFNRIGTDLVTFPTTRLTKLLHEAAPGAGIGAPFLLHVSNIGDPAPVRQRDWSGFGADVPPEITSLAPTLEPGRYRQKTIRNEKGDKEEVAVVRLADTPWVLGLRIEHKALLAPVDDLLVEMVIGIVSLSLVGAFLMYRILRPLAGRLSLTVEELAAMNRDLESARREADHANRAKSNFLAAMSHDLRTPLNAILGFSDMIRREAFGPIGQDRYRDYVNDIHDSGQLLLNMINDVLDLSKIEAGKYDLAKDRICLTQMTNRILHQFSAIPRAASLRFTTDIADDLPALNADERVLTLVLNNLVSNAVKFTPAGGTIGVSAWLNRAGAIKLSVTDTGCGMTDTDLDRVLNPYEQAQPAPAKTSEGTGLGLYLCRRFMALFGGKLHIASVPGEGTRVTLCFPPERTLTAPPAAMRPSRATIDA